MSKHKVTQRLVAMALSAAMVLGLMPVSVAARAADLPDGSGEIIAFANLAPEVAVQTVPLGTERTTLNLPATLTATVRVVAAVYGQGAGQDPMQEAEQEPEQEPVPDPDQVQADGTTAADQTAEPDAAGSEQAQSEQTQSEQTQPPSEQGDGTHTSAPISMEIPVTWVASPDYQGSLVGVYTFTAGIVQATEMAGLTVSVVPPVITVTVVETERKGLVTAFEKLTDELRWQNTAVPVLPAKLAGVVEGEPAQIPVTWEPDHRYDTDAPEAGLYVFTAQPGEGYALAVGVEAPRMTIYIPAAQRMMARMAGGGTDTSPLEITTAAQLAEIAVLVNAGRLETFLFNNSSATVYLELKNDLDLSGYGGNWNGGKGWVPIGNIGYAINRYPFRGNFSGKGHTISGLYINNSDPDTGSNAGLFGLITSGRIENLVLTAVSISGYNCVGGIAGNVTGNSAIENCRVSGSVSGNANVGGVVGTTSSLGSFTSISKCSFAGTVDGSSSYIGGLVGDAPNVTILNSYADAAVSGGTDVGGLVGELSGSPSSIQNCYATGEITGAQNVGGLVGSVLYGATIENSVALNSSVKATTSASAGGRVAGGEFNGTLTGNVAFAGMTVTLNGSPKTPKSDADSLDGEDIGAAVIKADGSIEGRFTAADGWTVEVGKLPGLFGTAVAMPTHITDSSDPNFPGRGTLDSPFLIGTAAQLAKMAELVNAGNTTYEGASYKLTADIDLSGYTGGAGWIPIGNNSTYRFRGCFDGGGKTITGLTINNSSRSYAGLFGYVTGGTLENVTVSSSVSGADHVGVVVGLLNTSAIQNCHASGSVSTTTGPAGGLAGRIYNSSRMLNCSAAVAVSGAHGNLGGVVGIAEMSSIIQNCYATGNVSGGNSTGYGVGGVVGNVIGSANTVENCYATGAVSGNISVGGVAGIADVGTTVKNCAALNPSVSSGGVNVGRVVGIGSTLSGNVAFDWIMNGSGGQLSTADDGAGTHGASRTADELQGPGSFPSAFTAAPWTYEPGRLPGLFDKTVAMPVHITAKLTGYFAGGNGSPATPYLINTAAQLAKLAELVNAGDPDYSSASYKLISDIDLSGYTGGKGWLPIGNDQNDFRGHFDGGGKTVNGLTISDSSRDYAGLFGCVTGGTLENFAVSGSVSGGSNVGVVVGFLDNSTVQNCHASGSVSAGFSVGGLAGYAYNSSRMLNCSAAVAVSGARVVSGGVAGIAEKSSIIQDCYATGHVIGDRYVGGVVGSAFDDCTVQSCYATGAVCGNSEVGGVAGFVVNGSNTVQNCAALNPSVKGNSYIGRVIGYKASDSTLANNHAFSGLIGGGTDKTTDGLDGADLSIQTAMSGALFWHSIMNWDASVWTIQNGKLPMLTGYAGQSGDGGLYLTERDLAYATVTVNGTYTYTGLLITPDITVTFDGTTLVKDTDYSATYTNNTNAGTASVSIIGKGNYQSTVSQDFTIAKRPVTVRAENKSITAGSALPTFTYTVDGQLAGETALIGTPVVSSPTANPSEAGSYPITVDLTGITYASNYMAANPAFTGGTLTVNNQPSSGGSSDAYIPPANQIHIIGRTGGNLTYAGLTLIVPPNALPANATLTILRLTSQGLGATLPPTLVPRQASEIYEIRSTGAKDLGEQTITVRLPYSSAKIAEGEQPIIHYFDEATGEWVAVATEVIQENGQWYAVAPVSRLGQLAVFSTPIPEGPEEPTEEPVEEPQDEPQDEPRVISLTIGQTVVDLDGGTLELDVQPYVQAGRTMVPLRFIGEALGAQVEWYEANQQVIIRRGDQWILLTIGSTRALVNGTPYDLDCTPEVIEPGRTMVPLRFISEQLGAVVEYDEQTGEIRITMIGQELA